MSESEPSTSLPTYITAVNPRAMETEIDRAKLAELRGKKWRLGKTDILYCASGILAVHKPSGLYVQDAHEAAKRWLDCEGVKRMDCVELKVEEEQESSGRSGIASEGNGIQSRRKESVKLQLLHRLDRDTSGVLLLSSCKETSRFIRRAFETGSVHKTYVCLCFGDLPSWKKITVTTGHGRSKHGLWRIYDKQDVGRRLPGGSYIRSACTHFEVESVESNGSEGSNHAQPVLHSNAFIPEDDKNTHGMPKKSNWVQLRVQPVTGRTHQIRLHCAFLGLAIAGDIKYYGTPINRDGTALEHHLLHSECVEFPHPHVSSQSIIISARRPIWAVSDI